MYASISLMKKDGSMSDIARAHFFAKQVHMPVWKIALAGKNELRVMDLLKTMGYELDKDYQRQYPIAERYVIDIAFVNEQIAIEVDGENHRNKGQRIKDRVRDRYLASANWVTIRVDDKILFGPKASFYKFLIDEVVKERRIQYDKGILFPIDFKRFNDSDYE